MGKFNREINDGPYSPNSHQWIWDSSTNSWQRTGLVDAITRTPVSPIVEYRGQKFQIILGGKNIITKIIH